MIDKESISDTYRIFLEIIFAYRYAGYMSYTRMLLTAKETIDQLIYIIHKNHLEHFLGIVLHEAIEKRRIIQEAIEHEEKSKAIWGKIIALIMNKMIINLLMSQRAIQEAIDRAIREIEKKREEINSQLLIMRREYQEYKDSVMNFVNNTFNPLPHQQSCKIFLDQNTEHYFMLHSGDVAQRMRNSIFEHIENGAFSFNVSIDDVVKIIIKEKIIEHKSFLLEAEIAPSLDEVLLTNISSLEEIKRPLENKIETTNFYSVINYDLVSLRNKENEIIRISEEKIQLDKIDAKLKKINPDSLSKSIYDNANRKNISITDFLLMSKNKPDPMVQNLQGNLAELESDFEAMLISGALNSSESSTQTIYHFLNPQSISKSGLTDHEHEEENHLAFAEKISPPQAKAANKQFPKHIPHELTTFTEDKHQNPDLADENKRQEKTTKDPLPTCKK